MHIACSSRYVAYLPLWQTSSCHVWSGNIGLWYKMEALEPHVNAWNLAFVFRTLITNLIYSLFKLFGLSFLDDRPKPDVRKFAGNPQISMKWKFQVWIHCSKSN